SADADLVTYFNPNSYVASTLTSIVVPNLTSTPVLTADFGFWAVVPGSIGDTVCRDANSDGLCSPGEVGVPGVVVYLYRDTNGDGSGDVLIGTRSTSITGTYTFGNLGPGAYVVSVNRADPALPAGYVLNTPNLGVTLAAGQNVTTADFPVAPLITKQASRVTANYSDTIVYTITQNYSGDSVLEAARVRDGLPAGTSFVTASAGAVFGPYTPIPPVLGYDDQTTFSTGVSVTVAPTATRQGSVVTVTMRLTSTTTISNVVPVLTAVGGNATCSAPAPSGPVTVTNAAPATFVFTCTVSNISEYIFLGNAAGFESGAAYSFPQGASNSVLSSKTGSVSVVSWALGSTIGAVDGTEIGVGSLPYLYANQGGGSNELMSHNEFANTWSQDPPADQATTIRQGGALVWNGTPDAGAEVYALVGNNKTIFRSYMPSTDSWTNRANIPGTVKYGSGLTRIGGVIYALRGNGTLNFYTYTISSDTWAAAASVLPGPSATTVNAGGALATDGTYVYAYKGNSTNEFYRYDPATNTWLSRATTPAAIGKGGALVYLNSHIYGTRGSGSTPFYRYDPATNIWSDAAVADVPANVTGGGSLATNGKLIYLLVGGNKTFDRFDPAAGAAGTWTIRASAPQNIGDGGALALVPGTATVAKSTVIDASQTMINTGQKITLTMSLLADSNLTDPFSPSALTISDTAQAGGTATCVGPTPASLPSLISGTLGLFTWTCTLTATNLPANITFGGNASRGAPGAFSFPFATSHSVIVVPPLTLTVRVLSPTSVSLVENLAVLLDTSGSLGPAPSNLVQTTIGSGIGDFVWADLNGNGLQDVGEPGIPGVVVSLSLPGGSVVTAITDPNGNYFFGNLGAGAFTVTYNLATAPAGFIPTTPTKINVTLASNQVITTVDFGLLPPNSGSIGDQVWLDANNDGIYNPITESP
ncbi:MAG: SdrD B-like domain-containing protein, partial [Thermoflexales bacterium]